MERDGGKMTVAEIQTRGECCQLSAVSYQLFFLLVPKHSLGTRKGKVDTGGAGLRARSGSLLMTTLISDPVTNNPLPLPLGL
jgi:hypothetical protein